MLRRVPDPTALELLLRGAGVCAAQDAQRLWQALPPDEQEAAAARALSLGHPRLALAWSESPWIQAPAWLRLGEAQAARAALRPLPDSPLPGSARRAVLWARAGAQLGEAQALTLAQAARSQARREGDAAALIAAAALLGELEQGQGDPRQALRSLAEGLKVAELTGESADPHLLAVLAHVQAGVGSAAKARRTAQRALERSGPRGPARVLALFALGRDDEARQEAQAGELSAVWWGFLGGTERKEG